MRRVFFTVFLLITLAVPALASAAPMSRVDGVNLEALGQPPLITPVGPISSSAVTPDGANLLLGVRLGGDGGSALKLSTDPFAASVVQQVADNPGAGSWDTVLISPDGQYGYFGVQYQTPNPRRAQIVKMNLASMTASPQVDLLASPLQEQIYAGAISPDGQYGYFATYNQTGGSNARLVKFNLSTMTASGSLDLGNQDTRAVLISPDGQTGYTVSSSGNVHKIDLAAMAELSQQAPAGIATPVQSAVISPAGNYAYLGGGSSGDGKVTMLNLSTMSVVGTPLDLGGTGAITSSALSPDGSYGYFGSEDSPSQLVRVFLSDMVVDDTLTLNAGETPANTMAISPDGQFVYVGLGSVFASLAAKVRVATKHTLTVSKSGSGAVSGSGIDCGSSCSLSRLDYQNTNIDLTATPAAGQVFKGWTGACSGTGTCSISLTGDKAVGATFEAAPNPGPEPGPQPGPDPDPQPDPQPDPSVSIASVQSKVTKQGAYITSKVTVSGAGKINQRATTGSKKLTTRCRASKNASAAGAYTLKCDLGKKGRKALKKSSLKLTLRTSFTPAGGSAIFANKNLTIKRKR